MDRAGLIPDTSDTFSQLQPMKTIIAGSRTIINPLHIPTAVDQSGFTITEVVSGGARGIDYLGRIWAERNNIPVKLFPADWDLYGRSAGYVRNARMALYADALIAIWDGISNGTRDMIKQAKSRNLKVYIYQIAS